MEGNYEQSTGKEDDELKEGSPFIIHVQVGVSSCRHGFVIYCVVITAPTG